MRVLGAGPRPCSTFFLSPAVRTAHSSNRPRRCVGDHIGHKAVAIRLMHGSLAKEAFMRTIFLAAAALAAMSLTSIPAHADGAWCARDALGGTNCGFYTYAQCQADISGIGGSCVLNPNYKGCHHSYPRYARRPPR